MEIFLAKYTGHGKAGQLQTQDGHTQHTTFCISVHNCLHLSTQLSVSQYTAVCISVHNCLHLSTQLSVSQYTTDKCAGL